MHILTVSVLAALSPVASALCPANGTAPLTPDTISLHCDRLFRLNPGAADGEYALGPPGERYRARCERDASDGGGWTIAMHTGSAVSYTPDPAMLGDPTAEPHTAAGVNKLPDRSIVLSQLGAWPGQEYPLAILRFRGSTDLTRKSWFVRGRLGRYNDALTGMNMIPFGATVDVCHAHALADCAWTTHLSRIGNFDLRFLDPPHPDRYDALIADHHHTDASPTRQLYPNGVASCRDNGNQATAGARCFVDSDITDAREEIDPFVSLAFRAVGSACGDGVLDPVLETCDDGNAVGGDGCSETCEVEAGWLCDPVGSATASRCWRLVAPATATCGNGVREASDASFPPPFYEECDDGNIVGGDGCSPVCKIEYGYSCPPGGGPCELLKGATCEHVHRRLSPSSDGYQTVGSTAVDGGTESLYCMHEAADGGAWTPVLHFGPSSPGIYTPSLSLSALGDPTVIPGAGSNVNLLSSLHRNVVAGPLGARNEWRFSSNQDAANAHYYKLRTRWFDAGRGARLLIPKRISSDEKSAPVDYCYGPSRSGCGFSPSRFGAHLGFDTIPGSGNDCTRIFFDGTGGYDDRPKTFSSAATPNVAGDRSFHAGSSCSGHVQLTSLTISIRPACGSCGDGCTDPFDGYEECDDGGTDDNDGCSSTCRVEPGYVCSRSDEHASICVPAARSVAAREQSCYDHILAGRTASGVYAVFPPLVEARAVRFVYCDMVADPDATGADPAGGWTLMTSFSQTATNQNGLTPWRYDVFGRLGLWTEGSSQGAPVDHDPSSKLIGNDLNVWSHNWREHFESGRAVEMRQQCSENFVSIVDIAYEVTPHGDVKQAGTFDLFSRAWIAARFRDITNLWGITWSRGNEIFRFFPPYREDDASPTTAPGGDMVAGCSGYSVSGCCTCEGANVNRAGSAGIIGGAADSQDPAFPWFPLFQSNNPNLVLAYKHQDSGLGFAAASHPYTFPLTCRYWQRPLPAIHPPVGSRRTEPLLHFTFDAADVSGATVLNRGTLGAAGNGDLVGTCSGSTGLKTVTTPWPPQVWPAWTLNSSAGVNVEVIAFDGNEGNCFVQIPSPLVPVVGHPFTISFWFKQAVYPPTPGQLLFFRGDADGSWESREFLVYIFKGIVSSGAQAARVIQMVGHSLEYLTPDDDTFPTDTDWHHYALVNSGSTTELSHIYVDGEEVASYRTRTFPSKQGTNDPVGVDMDPNKIFTIGGLANQGSFASHLSSGANGLMDDVKIFGDALEIEEIRSVAGLTSQETQECEDGNEFIGDGCAAGRTEGDAWACAASPGPAGEPIPCSRQRREARSAIGDLAPETVSRTCSHLFALNPCLPDGAYALGPPTERYQAWCERGNDPHHQEGWTVILHRGKEGPVAYIPAPGMLNNPASKPRATAGYHKLRDADIRNAQAGLWGQRDSPRYILRIRTFKLRATDGKDLFVRGPLGNYVDNAKGMGLFRWGAATEFCRAESLAACGDQDLWIAATHTHAGTLDLHHTETPSLFFPNRVFFDHHDSTGTDCYTGSAHLGDGNRCISTPSGVEDEMDFAILTLGPICGDGVVDPALEECDDGGTAGGDGCSADCRVEADAGWLCAVPDPDRVSTCWKVAAAPAGPVCGNGAVEVSPANASSPASPAAPPARYEECDDGNTAAGDGCSSACRVEYGYRCPVPGQPCVALEAPTCEHLFRADTAAADGVHTVGRRDARYAAWCERVPTDGGAMMKLYHHHSNSTGGGADEYEPSAYAIGNPELPQGTLGVHKLSDASIAAMYGDRASYRGEYRLNSSETPAGEMWFYRTDNAFRDRSLGWGFVPYTPGLVDASFKGPQTIEKCYQVTMDLCDTSPAKGWTRTGMYQGFRIAFDTMPAVGGTAGFSGDSCDRIFFDHELYRCYSYQPVVHTATRCFNAGATCASYPQIKTLSVFARPRCGRCGDGCTDPHAGYEECDDGNTADGDGCSSTCRVEPGYVCSWAAEYFSVCTAAAHPRPRSCLDHARAGASVNGVYATFPENVPGRPVRQVFCDMQTSAVPDPAYPGDDEGGGWDLLTAFGSHRSTFHVSQAVYDNFFKHALWIKGHAQGTPLRVSTEDFLAGTDLAIQSRDWAEFFSAGRTYELRQRCRQRGDNSTAVDIVWDAVSTGTFEQLGPASARINRENWRVRNRRIIMNTAGITFLSDALTSSRKPYMWMPYRADGGADFTSLLGSCNGYNVGACCNCVTDDNRRFGNAGIVSSAASEDYVSLGWMPHLAHAGADTFSIVAVQTFSTSTPAGYLSVTTNPPMMCQYLARPKPQTTPPASLDGPIPAVRFLFDPSELIEGGTQVRNRGYLGAEANGTFVGNCHNGPGDPLSPVGCSGHAVRFTGTFADCHVTVPHPVLPTIGSPFTVAFWFNFDVQPSLQVGSVIASRSDGDTLWEHAETAFYLTPAASAYPAAESGGGILSMVTYSSEFSSPMPGTMPDDAGMWHHYAFVSDGTHGGSTIYVDGEGTVLRQPGGMMNDFATHIFKQSAEDWRLILGGPPNMGAVPNTVRGAMDSFEFYPVALSAQEVRQAASRAASVVAFSRVAHVVSEDAGSVQLEISISSSTCARLANVTVDVVLSSGTADLASDVSAVELQRVTFAPGDTVRFLEIPIVQDAVPERNETFTVTLAPAAGLETARVTPGLDTATVTILADPPVVTAVSPAGVPAAGGALVTVHGFLFGETPGELVGADVNGSAVAAYSWVSETVATLVAPAGTAGAAVAVGVVTSAGPSAPAPGAVITYAAAPVVESLSQGSAWRLEAPTVTLRGRNMGIDPGDLASVVLAGSPCDSVTWRNSQWVECAAPSGVAAGSGPVTVTTVSGGASAPALLFSFRGPVISAVSPPTVELAPAGTAVSATVDVQGSGIGIDPADLLAINITGPAGTTVSCAPPLWVSASLVRCAVPGADILSNGTATVVIVTRLGGVSTAAAPGANTLELMPPSAAAATAAPDPPDHGANTTNVTSSAPPPVDEPVAAEAPVVTAVVPASGPATGGDLITVRGLFLGMSRDDVVSVRAAGVLCSVADWTDASTVSCVTGPAPPAVAANGTVGPVAVTTASGGSSAPAGGSVLYEYLPGISGADVAVTSVTPAAGTTRGGTTVTIAGIGFGASPGDVARVTFGSAGGAASHRFESSTRIIAVTPPSYPPGRVPVAVVPSAGGLSTVPFLGFRFEYPAPRIENTRPRVLDTAGSVPVTIRGSFFRPARPASLRVTIGGAECTSPAWVSESVVSCVSPPLSALPGVGPAGADDPAAIDVPVEVVVDGETSGPVRIAALTGSKGVRFSDTPCSADCQWNSLCDERTGSCGLCSPGYVGAPTCETPALEVLVLSVAGEGAGQGAGAGAVPDVVVSEDGGAGVPSSALLQVRILEQPDNGPVTFAIRSDPPGQVSFVPDTVTFSADDAYWSTPAVVSVDAVQDGLRDGNATAAIEVTMFAGGGRFALSPFVPRLSARILDALPTISSLIPKVVPLVGGEITLVGDHWDDFVAVYVEGKKILEANVALPPPSGGDAGVRAAARTMARTRRTRRDSNATSSSSSPSSSPSPSPPSPSSPTAPAPVARTLAGVRLNASHFRDDGGYHVVTIANLFTGTNVSDANILFATEDCPTEGQFGIGKDCEDCPTGGYCPGGYRVWPLAGYWNPGEDSGFVEKCDPPLSCPGCDPDESYAACYLDTAASSPCAVGHSGYMCTECETGGPVVYFRDASGLCIPCPPESEIMISIAAMVVLWVLLAIAGVAIVDREVLSHLVSLIMAIQEIAGIGQLVSHRLPTWIRKVYHALWLFSGDFSFSRPACNSPSEPVVELWIALAFLVAIGIPMHLLCFIFKVASRDEERKVFFRHRQRRLLGIHGLVAYLSVASRAFGILSCIRTGGELRMTAEPAQVCFEGLHIFGTVTAAIVVVAFVIGFPFGTYLHLRRNSSLMYGDNEFEAMFDATYEPFKPQWRHTWLAEIGINVVLAACASVLAKHPRTQLAIAVTAFTTFLVFLAAARPFRRSYENIVMGLLQVASILAVTIIYLSDIGTIEAETAQEGILLYTLVAFVAIVLGSFVAMFVAGLVGPRGYNLDGSRVGDAGDNKTIVVLDGITFDTSVAGVDGEEEYEYETDDGAGAGRDSSDGIFDQLAELVGFGDDNAGGSSAARGSAPGARRRVRAPAGAVVSAAATERGGGGTATLPRRLPVVEVPGVITARAYEAPGLFAPILRAVGFDSNTLPATPGHWTSGGASKAKHVAVDVTGALKSGMQKLLDATCKVEHLGTGVDASATGHTKLEVTAVHRIENGPLWVKHKFNAEAVAQAWSSQKTAVPALAAATDKPSSFLPESEFLLASAGEKILLHGTTSSVADIVADRGFDMRVARAGMFSVSGIYFAAHSSKADEYASPDPDSGECELIVARVIVGRPFPAANALPLPRPPCLRGHTGGCGHDRFDSVFAPTTSQYSGGALTKHEEFVLYDNDRAYPAYRVKYIRK